MMRTGILLTDVSPTCQNRVMNQKEDPMDWDDIKKLEVSRRIELLTKAIVDKCKQDVENKFGEKKRHRQ